MDKELKVMQEVVGLLEKLDENQKRRVVRWFSDRFGDCCSRNEFRIGSEFISGSLLGSETSSERRGVQVGGRNMHSGSDLLSQLQDKDVKTEGDKVMVVMKWLVGRLRSDGTSELRRAEEGFTAYEVNQELKKVGMKVGNITSAFKELIKKGLVVQVDKKGRFKQGRKRYKLALSL